MLLWDLDALDVADNTSSAAHSNFEEDRDMMDDGIAGCEDRVGTSDHDSHEWLDDVVIQDTNVETIMVQREEKTLDVGAFFSKPYSLKAKDGKTHNVRDCQPCKKCGCACQIVSDASMCHRHIAFLHIDAYRKWCKDNNFTSMLASDVKEQKTAPVIASAQQTTIDGHLTELPETPVVIPYSVTTFREATIEWLISTGQPIQAVNHSSFKKMIDIAARATHGVIVPNRKATCHEIMDSFKKQMSKLKECLNASNVDGYFTVTGHWIKEMATTAWELQCAVLGFTQLNNAHNGQQLGQALFKIVDHVDIAHKVGYTSGKMNIAYMDKSTS
ncbi:hypothetical protein AZE42_13376, partial [Rhizopogon vesiculosus]